MAKDVPFALFVDLYYRDLPVTKVRHGNTIPGEVGREVVKRFFEAGFEGGGVSVFGGRGGRRASLGVGG